MERRYVGNLEGDGSGWDCLGVVGVCDGVEWIAYQKDRENGTGWDYVKLVADGRVPRKANYWLSWNGERFAVGRDFLKLRDHRQGLCQMLVDFMENVDGR